jgi:hypothetical protein
LRGAILLLDVVPRESYKGEQGRYYAMDSRRSWLRRMISAAVLFVLGYWIDKGLEEVLPDQLPPITGTANITLGELTAEGRGIVV